MATALELEEKKSEKPTKPILVLRNRHSQKEVEIPISEETYSLIKDAGLYGSWYIKSVIRR